MTEDAPDMPFDDYMNMLGDLSTPLPYSNPTLRIFIDCLTSSIAVMDVELPREGKVEFFLRGIAVRILARVRQASTAPSIDDLNLMFQDLVRTVIIYQHHYAQEAGQALPRCSLDPPCRFHNIIPPSPEVEDGR